MTASFNSLQSHPAEVRAGRQLSKPSPFMSTVEARSKSGMALLAQPDVQSGYRE
jgi:hypothetical protein